MMFKKITAHFLFNDLGLIIFFFTSLMDSLIGWGLRFMK
jgi:hypothetical protein